MTILFADPRVLAVPVVECGEPLVRLDAAFGIARVAIRRGVADRLERARDLLPRGFHLQVSEGYRHPADQQSLVDRYAADLCRRRPRIGPGELHRLTSRHVASLEVAPHTCGAAVSVTLVDVEGDELDLGSPMDATPEESGGRCYTAFADLDPDARSHRGLLTRSLAGAGLVNYPAAWWHWSYGDRYWSLTTGAPAARYGPVDATGGGEAIRFAETAETVETVGVVEAAA